MLLVTTAIEDTWGNDEDILFLGEWCKLYERKAVWSTRKHKVLQYHWNDRIKLKNDFDYLQALNKKILTSLTNKLNKLHSVNHSERYWNIILGYWLNLFTAVLYDRWFMIKRAEESGLVNRCLLLNPKNINCTANDTTEFVSVILDDPWNEAIYSELIKNWNSIDYEILPKVKTSGNQNLEIKTKRNLRRSILELVITFSSIFSKKKRCRFC